MQMNEIFFAGYAGADAQIRTTKTGKEGVSLRVCHTQKGRDGQPDESTWVNVQVYGVWSETARLVKKGDNVIVSGSLRVTQYQDKAGAEKTSVSIFCRSLALAAKAPPAAASPVHISDDFEVPF